MSIINSPGDLTDQCPWSEIIDSGIGMKNGLLLGAGFSYDLGMPLTVELTEVFLNVFTDDIVEQMAKAMSLQQPYSKDRPIDPKAIRQGWDSLVAYNKSGGNNYDAFGKLVWPTSAV
jgi:hypothetical protein